MDGLLLIDKPAGITSHDVVDRVRRIAHTRRVGHAGTLDPFATGLLIIGVNKGTKALTALVGTDKTYDAVARLGATSSTEDPEGTITERPDAIPPTADAIEMVLDQFRGGYEQTASAFSAKKIGGKKLYELARKGTIEGIILPKKEVAITALNVTRYDWPTLAFHTACGSGTYIRALARDIGDALGCGAYLTALRRTRVGNYDIAQAIPLDALNPETLAQRLIPLA
ncbi:MAG: tRNA pseudouridine(55) synthase TruB [Candidatus Parcubacteria bacterium]|jgi:tRNA pseudouridine55 synthase